jgi:PhnB protein
MSKTRAIPENMHTVTPHLICAGAADAIEFYKKAFNATETTRLRGRTGDSCMPASGSATRP